MPSAKRRSTRRASNAESPITVTASEDEADNFNLKSITKEVSQAKLSPDGKVMALVAYGEVYVRNIEEKSPTRRVTDTHARERNIAREELAQRLRSV